LREFVKRELMSDRPWKLPDEKLLAECRFEAYRSSGPGGQKKNKSSVAVRYTHVPTSIQAHATDSRSQRENRIHALRALRHKLALEIRHEIDPMSYQPPAWLGEYPSLHINPKNPLYPSAVAEVLDVIKGMQWSIGRAAVMLGQTTSALTRFLHDDPPLWAKVNLTRVDLGMKPLKWE
jgi:hypothetical protein